MNIFYLDNNPALAAQYHCDKHVVKMILESAQLLSTAWHCTSPNIASTLPIYKKTHYNHPSAKWTRLNVQSYMWLSDLGKNLCIEYTHRYNKRHKTEDIIDFLKVNIPELPKSEWVEPFQAMPDEYKNDSSLIAYRNYYRFAKRDLLNYTNRDFPDWIYFN